MMTQFFRDRTTLNPGHGAAKCNSLNRNILMRSFFLSTSCELAALHFMTDKFVTRRAC